MSDEVLVSVENVSKKFCRSLRKSLWYGVQDIGSELVGRKYEHELRPDEFWAVNDVSFELRRGECLGLIGPNGAGKSTLLKILNGLIKPDRGSIDMWGRVSALIELTAGFNPILTGLENIYSRGAILGLSKAEVDYKLDEIVEFAEIDDFLHAPVQSYSSGMKVRLGFAVAAQLEPDVLILDEVLAVGDVGFRAKCFNQIHNIMQNSAVILVSHSMPQIARVCSDIIVLSSGQSVYQGQDVSEGIEIFYSCFKGEKETITGSGRAIIDNIILESKGKKGINTINYLDDLSIYLDTIISPDIIKPCINITIMSQELQNVAQCSSFFNDFEFLNSGQRMQVSLSIPRVELNPSIYSLGVTIHSENMGEVLCKHYNTKQFRVRGIYHGYAPLLLSGKWEVNREINVM